MAQGPREKLTNVIIIEEAHNLLLAKQAGARESVLETSIRMIRQYGLGYIFVDQSASLLSKVAFANSYATIALSQKLRADVQTMSGAMNLTDEQKDSLSTLPIGSAVVRLADEHPEPFLVKLPRCAIREGSVSDSDVRQRMAAYSGESGSSTASLPEPPAIPAVPLPDRKSKTTENTHPPSPRESRSGSVASTCIQGVLDAHADRDMGPDPPKEPFTRDEIRFLADVANRPLSTTVARYQRLNFSRRRGNAIRQSLAKSAIIEAVPVATRSGQVVLYQLTDHGRSVAKAAGIGPGPPSCAGLEHRYWVGRVAAHFERQGYDIAIEFHIPGDGHVDLVASRPGERVAIEIETGKSDIDANLKKLRDVGFDRVVLVATSATAVGACEKAIRADTDDQPYPVELMTWLDVG